jgi:hypothetical protein
MENIFFQVSFTLKRCETSVMLNIHTASTERQVVCYNRYNIQQVNITNLIFAVTMCRVSNEVPTRHGSI